MIPAPCDWEVEDTGDEAVCWGNTSGNGSVIANFKCDFYLGEKSGVIAFLLIFALLSCF